jgi:tetratricopeptide (TPR) repeat protein
LDEAFAAFYQATWSAAWQSAGYHALAEIACHRGDRVAALDFVNRSLAVNALHLRALNLKAAVLRHLGREAEAREVLVAACVVDPLDVRALAESWLLDGSARSAEQLAATFREHPATALETAAEYRGAGLWGDGMAVLERAVDEGASESGISPLVYYYLASFAAELGETDRASHYRRLAAQTLPDHWFPFQDELIPILREAMDANPADARAPYHLGNLLFDWQPDQAVKLWERSAELDPSFPIVHRNLGIAYSHQAGGNILDQAIASLERAVALPDPHALHFTELDELYEAAGVAPELRLALLEQHAPVVARRDDALSRAIALKVLMGRCDEAIELMTGRRFDVWEGASISVAEHWIDAHLLRGHEHRAAGRYAEALKDYETALNVPDNLPTERRGTGSRLPEVRFWSGMAHAGLGHLDDAHQAWKESAGTPPGGAQRVGGATLTQRSPQRYYQARALEQLGRTETAIQIYRELVAAGQRALTEETTGIDFFASFGTQQSQRARLALAHHVAGLGHLGLGETERAREQFERTIEISPDHHGARSALRSLKPASAAENGRENGGGGAGTLHVLSYNLWDGFGPKPEPRQERWLEWMAEQRPDVAALQELNGYTPERLASEARGWGHAYSVLLKEDGHPTGEGKGNRLGAG